MQTLNTKIRNRREKARLRIKRAWDSGAIYAKIALRDRSEDNILRAKLDRKGERAFSLTLPCRTVVSVEWSRAGRTDQLDLVEGGAVIFTGRSDLAMKHLLSMSAAKTD
jgi:hypothetical protein